MANNNKCSGLVDGYCIHGFLVIPSTCDPLADQWGNFSDVKPECVRIEHCGKYYNDSGGKPDERCIEFRKNFDRSNF